MAEVSFTRSPAIDVVSKTEVIKTPTATPVDGVSVESVTTIAVATPPTVTVDVTPATVIPTAPVTAVVAVATPGTSAVIQSNPAALDEDNIGFEDVILPRINVVQKVGDLSNIFNPGEVVLNQTLVIHEPASLGDTARNIPATPGTGPLILTVLGFRRRQFTEKVEGNKLGLLLNDETELAKHNGTLDYKSWQQSIADSKVAGGPPAKKYFQRLATGLILVQKPAGLKDDDHVHFPYECEGQFYALALWSMKGTGYTHGAKTIFTARKIGHLRDGYTAQQWGLTSKLEKFGENFAYVPVIKPAAKNSPAFRQFSRDVLGAGN